VSGLRTLKPINLKNKKPKKNFFIKNLGFPALMSHE